MHFNQVEFGCRLRRARRERGFTQERLAEELNISTDHLGKLELGRRGVSIDLLIDISNALHVTLDYLDTFDAELFGELVDKIIVESNDSIRFRLKNGLELRERIERTVR